MRKPGLFLLQEADLEPEILKVEGLSKHDKNLLAVFDINLKNVKQGLRNFSNDVSAWQTI